MRAHVVQWVLEDLDRRLVVGLGVMYEDEPHREPVRLAASEVEVPVVTGVLRILVIGGRNEPALDLLRAVKAGVLAIEKREGTRRTRVRRQLGSRERDGLAGARRASRTLLDDREDVIREAQRDARFVGAAVLRDGAVPLAWIRRRAADGVACIRREQRRARADVLRRAGLDLRCGDAAGGGCRRDAARPCTERG